MAGRFFMEVSLEPRVDPVPILRAIGVEVVERTGEFPPQRWFLTGAALGEIGAKDVNVIPIVQYQVLAAGEGAPDDGVKIEIDGTPLSARCVEFVRAGRGQQE